MSKPSVGDIRPTISKLNDGRYFVVIKVFKENTLRGDAYWVSKGCKWFKTLDEAEKYCERIQHDHRP